MKYKKTSKIRFSLLVKIAMTNEKKAKIKIELYLKSISFSLNIERKNITTKRLDKVSDNPEVLNTTTKGVSDNIIINTDNEKLFLFFFDHKITQPNNNIEKMKFKMKIL